MTIETLYNEAHEAGMVALRESEPTPMIVGTPTSLFGNDIDTTKPVYKVDGGVCGFAWVNVKPARGKFVAWCKQNQVGRRDEYNGGYTFWVGEGGQSMERKMAYAAAFAKVLRDAGLNAYPDSRMD